MATSPLQQVNDEGSVIPDDFSTTISPENIIAGLQARAAAPQGIGRPGMGALSGIIGNLPQDYSKYKNMEESESAKIPGLMQARLSGLQDYKPDDTSMWLSMAQHFLAPTKGGSFGESLSNVAGGLQPIVSKESELKNAYKQKALEIAQQNSQQLVQNAQAKQKDILSLAKLTEKPALAAKMQELYEANLASVPGITPAEAASRAGASLIAEANVKGTQSFAPGATVVNPRGEQTSLPNAGVQNVQLPDGRWVALTVPGAIEQKAAEAGATTSAQEEAKAKQELTTINNKLTTKAQAIKAISGEPEAVNAKDLNVVTPEGETITMWDTSKDKENLAFIRQLPKEDRLAATQSYSTYKNYEKQQKTSGSIPGIKLQTEAEKAIQTTEAKLSGENLPKSKENATTAVDAMINNNEARRAINASAFQGSGAETKLELAKIAKGAFGVDILADKIGNTDYLKSILGENVLKRAKTLGANPSDQDRKFIMDIVGQISKDPTAMGRLLDYSDKMLRRSVDQHNAFVAKAEKSSGGNFIGDWKVEVPDFSKKPSNKVQSTLMKYAPSRAQGEQ